MSISRTRTGVVLVFALTLGQGIARAADCTTAAATEMQSICKSYPNASFSVDLSHIGGKVGTQSCAPSGGAATENRVAVFETIPAKTRPQSATPAAPAGYALDPMTPKWSIVSSAGNVCPDLVYVLYQTPGGAPPPQAAPGLAAPAPGAAAAQLQTMRALHRTVSAPATSPTAAVMVIRNYRQAVADANGLTAPVAGTATGFESVADEALQILGQIVVDRATAQAFQLIKNRLVSLLQCQDNYTSPIGFNNTCRVLVPLRIQDIATSRNALLGGLVSDVIAYVETKATQNNDWKTAVGVSFSAVITTTIVPLVAKPKAVLDDSAAKKVLTAILTYASTEIPTTNLTPAQEAVAVGVLAYLQCLSPDPDATGETDPSKILPACDVGANVVKLANGKIDIIPAAQGLAQDLVTIAMPTPKGGDGRPRLITAVDTTFSTACMLLRDSTLNAKPTLACDDPTTTIQTKQDILALIQPIVVAAIDRDTNAMIAAAVEALQIANSTLEAKDASRAFVLIGGILDYTATYTNPPAGSTTDSLHDQRTKILESLTTDMTNRTGRVGDTIAALSGTLRVMAGRRFAVGQTSEHAFLGPLSLPLGFSLTHLGEPSNWCYGCGIHLQLDAVDLGQYLSYNDTATVAKPTVADALSPSATIAVAWGSSMPVVVGLTGGYSPNFEIDPNNPTHKGTYNLGVSIGINVPLIDIN
jgi:hypothetical protein